MTPDKTEKLLKAISPLIMFCSTILIPNLINYVLQMNLNISLLAAVVSTIVFCFLLLIRKIICLKMAQQKTQEESNYEEQLVSSITGRISNHYEELLIYSINSRACAEVFKRFNCNVTECTILVRKYINDFGDKKRYDDERDEAVELWKEYLREGRISRLYIYEYDHISDHFYVIFDESILIKGFNNFEPLDSTGQHPEIFPPIYNDSPKKKEYIMAYKKNFKNLLEHYKNKKIYDSTK